MHNDDMYVSSIDGSDSMRVRANTIREFSNSSRGILCSAKVLNEGINIPIVDSVCFVDPRQSTIDIIQCIGRALRLYPKKKMAHVFVPVFIEDFNNDFDKDEFGSVIRIAKALQNTDERIVEEFQLRTNGGVGGNRIFVGETYVNVSVEINIDEWYDKIGAKVWKIIDNWNFRYNELGEWIKKHNRLPSSKSEDLIEKSLYYWCSDQRKNKKKGKLPNDKIKKLYEIDGWFWENDLDALWDDKYIELKKWIRINNRIPSRAHADLIEKSLSAWCCKQRQNKKNGILSDDKIEKLVKLNGWYWKKDSWNDKYSELNEWVRINNRIPSQTPKDSTENLLGYWCNDQRQHKKDGKLPNDKIEKLNKLNGWYWKKDEWNNKYSELKKWVKINNKMPSSKSKDLTEKILGIWCGRQRQYKKNGKLSNDRIKQLKKINGWYWSNESIIRNVSTFEDRYSELKKWIEKNNRIPSQTPKDSTENLLGCWCNDQRQHKKDGKLPNDKIEKLNKLDGWYWKKDEWNNKYSELKKWVKINNKMPSSKSKDLTEKILGIWCGRQRQYKKNGKLSNDRIKQLEKINGWYWSNESIIRNVSTF